jgi:hypothetical protein
VEKFNIWNELVSKNPHISRFIDIWEGDVLSDIYINAGNIASRASTACTGWLSGLMALLYSLSALSETSASFALA